MVSIEFIGASQQVTGSCYLLETGNATLLLECGMYQGGDRDNHGSVEEFAFDPATINVVVLSHAHLDHSGMLPLLVKRGFSGSIWATRATTQLLDVMLKDAAHIQASNVEWQNKRRRRSGRPEIEPVYTLEDVERTLHLLEPLDYGCNKEILPATTLCFRDAGHILGSAIVEIRIEEQGKHKTLVFSGDLGNSDCPLLRDPDVIEAADIVLMESTYGDRNHRSTEETVQEFHDVLTEAVDGGGNVFIPAFAVGRTQELLYYLGQFYQEGRLPQQQVFLDSPMANRVSTLYARHSALFSDEDPELNRTLAGDWKNWLPVLRYTATTQESMALNAITSGAIIIAGSGMCSGGRIMHHLKHNLWRRRSHIVFVGFQARGTLGRRLVDGAKNVRLMGEEYAVKAQIHTLGGFSAHAGQSQLIDWIDHFRGPRPQLFLVHGELEKMLVLQRELQTRCNWNARIPARGERVVF